jgi:zinc protease
MKTLINSFLKRARLSQVLIVLTLIVTGCAGFKNNDSDKSKSETASGDGTINLKVHKYTLSNGLRLLVYENKRLPIFSYHTFFDVGGRHESSGTTGATHFLEHMMFKGAKKYGPGIFDTMIESNGGNNNAYTSFDSTVYYENLPSVTREGDNLIDKIIDLEADRMENLLLLPKSFEAERQVVLEERKMRYENSPGGKLWLAAMQNIFAGTPYGGSVIGDISDLNSLSRDQVMGFFNKFYTPDNAVIVIAGDVDHKRIHKLVKEKFGHMKPSSKEVVNYRKKRNDPSLYTHRARYNKTVKLHGSNPTPMFMYVFPGVKLGERTGFVYDILGSIMGSGESSYLYQNLIKNKKPVLNSVSSQLYSLKYNGVFYVYGELRDKVSLKVAKKKVLSSLRKGCNKAVTERTLQKTKNQILKSYFANIQTNSGVAGFLGQREHFYDDYKYYQKEMKIYEEITLSEVKKACHGLFAGNRHIYLNVWKNNSKK